MHSWQHAFLGLRQFPLELTEFEIHYFFGFNAKELSAIQTRRGDLHRLAAAIHIGFIKMTGRTLDALDRIPAPVLAFVGDQLGVAAPELSTLRALYDRKKILFEHQSWAAKQLRFRPYSERRQRVLLTQLRRTAEKALGMAGLLRYAQQRLYDRRILLPSRRRLERLVGKVRREVDRGALAEARAAIADDVRRGWVKAALTHRTADQTCLEWLQTPPRGRSTATLNEALEKLSWLRALAVDRYSPSAIRLVRQRHYARKIRQRSSTRFRSDSEPRRGVELACFLRITLMQITDIIVSLVDMKILAIQRAAINRAREQLASVLPDSRVLLRRIRRLLEDDAIDAGALRTQLLESVPTEAALSQSCAARVRYLLSEPACPVRSLLKRFLVLAFESHQAGLLNAIDYLRAAYVLRHRTLPDEIDIGFAPRWRELLQGRDRRRALEGHRPTEDGIDVTLLSHISPIEWENVILYGDYVLDPHLIR